MEEVMQISALAWCGESDIHIGCNESVLSQYTI